MQKTIGNALNILLLLALLAFVGMAGYDVSQVLFHHVNLADTWSEQHSTLTGLVFTLVVLSLLRAGMTHARK